MNEHNLSFRCQTGLFNNATNENLFNFDHL